MVRKLHLLLTLMLLAVVNTAFAEDVAYKTLDFSTATKESVGAYTKEWKATAESDTWNIANFNNNNGSWKYIKCGRKSYDSEASITTGSAYATSISKVTVTIDDVDATKVKSIYLESAADENFTNAVKVEATNIQKGDLTFNIASPTVDQFYRIVFDCKAGTKNGIVQVSKVVYYTFIDANKKTSSVTFANANYEFKEGSEELKAFGGQKATTEPADAVLTYTSDKEWALVDNDGTVVLDEKAAGVAKITAIFDGNDEYNPSTASYTILVKHDLDGAGTAENPYSVKDILYLTDIKQQTADNIYVEGIVSKIDEISPEYGNATYYISADGASEKQFKCFRGLEIGGKKFTSADDMTLGDIVVVSGKIIEYEGTYELAQGNEIVSWKKGVKLNISDALYSTMYYSDRTVKVPEGVEAYTYTIEKNGENDVLKNNLNLTYKAGDVLPAGSAVVLYAATAGNYIFKATEEEGLLDDTNVLKGSDEATTTAGGTTYYRLTKQDGKVGFAWGAENGAAFQNGAHKAYLPYTPSVAGAKVAFFALNGETTGINTIVSASTVNEDAALYNLKGQRVNAAYKGIVIQNGKKFINK